MRIVAKVVRRLDSFLNFSRGFCSRFDSEMKPAETAAESEATAPQQPVTLGTEEFANIKKKVQEFVPRLKTAIHKGDCGRIAVVGGSFEYTGAPYFAAITALKMGVDLIHVFCSKDAGPIVKAYSPELMVHPCLDQNDGLKHIEPWLERFHVIVIGPGLGRNQVALKNVTNIINFCKKILRPAPPLIIDADALHLISEDINPIKHYPGPLLLTPNNVEYSKLCVRANENNPMKVAQFYNAVVIQKGASDVISNGLHTSKITFTDLGMTCTTVGTKKRCGGQGDLLAGCLSAFVAWATIYSRAEQKFDFGKLEEDESLQDKSEYVKENFTLFSLAAYAACVVARTSGKLAFDAKGRGMTTSDMVTFVDRAFRTHFELF